MALAHVANITVDIAQFTAKHAAIDEDVLQTTTAGTTRERHLGAYHQLRQCNTRRADATSTIIIGAAQVTTT